MIQKQETKRFMQVYNLLKKDGKVKNQTDFCKKLNGFRLGSFNQALLGNRDIPINAINDLCIIFQVSRDFIFDGIEPVFINPNDKKEKEKNEIQFLRELVTSQQKIIEELSKGKK